MQPTLANPGETIIVVACNHLCSLAATRRLALA